MGDGMRAIKIATIVMGMLIVLGTTVILVTIVRRTVTGPARPGQAYAVVLDEPAGTTIAGVTGAKDRLAIALHGGGADRVVLVDPETGSVVGRVSLGR